MKDEASPEGAVQLVDNKCSGDASNRQLKRVFVLARHVAEGSPVGIADDRAEHVAARVEFVSRLNPVIVGQVHEVEKEGAKSCF